MDSINGSKAINQMASILRVSGCAFDIRRVHTVLTSQCVELFLFMLLTLIGTDAITKLAGMDASPKSKYYDGASSLLHHMVTVPCR